MADPDGAILRRDAPIHTLGEGEETATRTVARSMPYLPTPPFLIHVIWHPDCHSAAEVAEGIRDHFGTHRFRNIAGGAGIDVVFQGTLGSGAPDRLPVAWHAGCPIACVAMIDRSLVEDPEWVRYLRDLGQRASSEGLGARLIPVAMEPGVQ